MVSNSDVANMTNTDFNNGDLPTQHNIALNIWNQHHNFFYHFKHALIDQSPRNYINQSTAYDRKPHQLTPCITHKAACAFTAIDQRCFVQLGLMMVVEVNTHNREGHKKPKLL